MSGSELARRAGASGPAVSRLVAGLADADVLTRHALAEDRRRHTLVLTDGGEQILDSAQKLLRGRLGALLSDPSAPRSRCAGARACPGRGDSVRRATAAPTAAPASRTSIGAAAPTVTLPAVALDALVANCRESGSCGHDTYYEVVVVIAEVGGDTGKRARRVATGAAG